jgi:ABC-type antimicrobial peptide transport system permease subunit
VLEAFLFGISKADPVTFVGAVALFLTMGVAAGLPPARRAAGVDPVVALRTD